MDIAAVYEATIVGGMVIIPLLSRVDESLLIRWNTFFFVDKTFEVLDGVVLVDFDFSSSSHKVYDIDNHVWFDMVWFVVKVFLLFLFLSFDFCHASLNPKIGLTESFIFIKIGRLKF